MIKNTSGFLASCGIFGLCLGIVSLAWGEGTAGQAGAFLKIGVDARPQAMGNAYAAACSDASAGYWNPGALSLISRQQAMATYASFPEGGDYSQIAYVMPLSEFGFPNNNLSGDTGPADSGTLGLTLIRFAAAYDIEARKTDSLNPDYLFSDVEGSYGLAYGLPIGENLHVGAGLKGLYHTLDREKATGWGVDAGLLWKAMPELTIGLAARDAFSQITWTTGRKEVFPVSSRIGIAYQLEMQSGQTVLVSTDLSHNWTAALPGLQAGLEYGLWQVAFLRAGWDKGNWTYGAGIYIPWIGWGRSGLKIDYAVREDRIAGWDHWFTLRLEL